MELEIKQISGGTAFWLGARYVALRLPPKKQRAAFRAAIVEKVAYALWYATHERPPYPDFRDPGFDNRAFIRSESARRGWYTRFRNELEQAYQEFLQA